MANVVAASSKNAHVIDIFLNCFEQSFIIILQFRCASMSLQLSFFEPMIILELSVIVEGLTRKLIKNNSNLSSFLTSLKGTGDSTG